VSYRASVSVGVRRNFCVEKAEVLFVFWVVFLFLIGVFGCVWVGFGVIYNMLIW